jgi:hypothetical protein
LSSNNNNAPLTQDAVYVHLVSMPRRHDPDNGQAIEVLIVNDNGELIRENNGYRSVV